MLAESGNAVDAAVATVITLTTVEPVSKSHQFGHLHHPLGGPAIARTQRFGSLSCCMNAKVFLQQNFLDLNGIR